MTERKIGHSRLVYNKATRTIDTVRTGPAPYPYQTGHPHYDGAAHKEALEEEEAASMLANYHNDAEMRVDMGEQHQAARREMRRLLLASKDEDMRDAYYRALTLAEHESRRSVLDRLDTLETALLDLAVEFTVLAPPGDNRPAIAKARELIRGLGRE